eukprot:TRINITY_DN5724_c0_g1_i5.p1 TRINITY_DN5724_c0_g1~~TRINITY_DN5724_c0_g1_i5.p1  ORF type:complete len:335 (-),score=46.91 TRINITY_DN5724_c0_g1_i5:777-1781(-)
MDELQQLGWQQISCIIGFVFVLHRALTLHNYPLLETDEKPKHGHLWRLITAAFYVPFVPGSAIYFPLIFKLFITLMIYLAAEEFMKVVFQLRHRTTSGEREQDRLLTLTKQIQTAGVIMSFSAYFEDHRIFGFTTYACFIIFISYFMWCFKRLDFKDNFFYAFSHLCMTLLLFFWVFWPLSHGIMMASFKNGGGYLTILLNTSWIGDAAAYYVGSKLGRTKVSEISPSKSWEGIIAEILFALSLVSSFWYVAVNNIAPWMDLPVLPYEHYFIIGLLIGTLGVIGDMFESLIKRAGKAKDSGIFFPGHGGVLDRFDSFLFICPAVYYYIYFIILQ